MRKVTVNLEAVIGGGHEGYYLLGLFRRKAKEQGWSEADLETVARQARLEDMATTLEPYVEASPEEEPPSFWRLWLDFVAGFYASRGLTLLPPSEWRWRPQRKD